MYPRFNEKEKKLDNSDGSRNRKRVVRTKNVIWKNVKLENRNFPNLLKPLSSSNKKLAFDKWEDSIQMREMSIC